MEAHELLLCTIHQFHHRLSCKQNTKHRRILLELHSTPIILLLLLFTPPALRTMYYNLVTEQRAYDWTIYVGPILWLSQQRRIPKNKKPTKIFHWRCFLAHISCCVYWCVCCFSSFSINMWNNKYCVRFSDATEILLFYTILIEWDRTASTVYIRRTQLYEWVTGLSMPIHEVQKITNKSRLDFLFSNDS